jgi:ankyrin repeat protein
MPNGETTPNPLIEIVNSDLLIAFSIMENLKKFTTFIKKIKLKANELLPSLLLQAARRGLPNIVEFLLDNKAKIDSIDIDGNTALHLAALHRHREVVQLLVNRKAKNIFNFDIPFHISSKHRFTLRMTANSIISLSKLQLILVAL